MPGGGRSHPCECQTTAVLLTARDAALNYISEHYAADAPPPDLAWERARITPEGQVGGMAFQYTAESWAVTISYPVVAPEAVGYRILVTNQTSGFRSLDKSGHGHTKLGVFTWLKVKAACASPGIGGGIPYLTPANICR